jgi:hypothetical protein
VTPEDLLDAWASLPTPAVTGQLESFETAEHSGVWAAVDYIGSRHLLVRVPDESRAPTLSTKGLSVTVARHRIAEHDDADYVDLVCVDEATADTFATVGADIAREVEGIAAEARVNAVAQTLARWRWFWGITPDRLSERDALGLFAELWFLDQWVGVSADSVEAWTGSDSARHDFQWPQQSVEVKATARRADGAVVHNIEHLDQLADPESGTLYLFSLRVVRDRLAANTLPGLVDRCSEQLRGEAASRESFLRKVSLRGYSPTHRRLHSSPYRILEERLYEVGNAFPRLTVGSFTQGLPAGIGDVSYQLDMAACQPFLRASGPDQWPPT